MRRRNMFLVTILACSSIFLSACGTQAAADTENAQTQMEETQVQSEDTQTVSKENEDDEVQLKTAGLDTSSEAEKWAGAYKTTFLFDNNYNLKADMKFVVNPYISEDLAIYEGSYEMHEDGFELTATGEKKGSEKFVRAGDYFYRVDSVFDSFEGDQENNQPITLDNNGRTSQEFMASVVTDADQKHTLDIAFHEDGTFQINYELKQEKGNGEVVRSDQFEGTYRVEDNLILLNYNDFDHPLVMADGRLYFYIVERFPTLKCGCD